MNALTGQTRLVIIGATGMVGGYALRYALENAAVGSVTAIVRRKLGNLASQAARGSASGLRGLLRTFGGALGSGRSGLLLGRVHRGGNGRGASHDNRGLHDRVRASSLR
jgi:hypothetical protein